MAIPSSSRLLDLAFKGWTQGLTALQHPRDLLQIVKWVGFKRVHLGELMSLYPLRALLQNLAPKTVIDVGANTGQFASVAGAFLPEARIFSFEPIDRCRKRCMKRMKGHPNFHCFELGVGEVAETRDLNISSFPESSSFLTMSALHRSNFPWTADHFGRSVEVVTLDSLVPDLLLEPPILLKVDVQGFEMSVLRGAPELLKSVQMIIIETAFQELYENQSLFGQLHDHLRAAGFDFGGAVQNISDLHSGRILQADSLFLRS